MFTTVCYYTGDGALCWALFVVLVMSMYAYRLPKGDNYTGNIAHDLMLDYNAVVIKWCGWVPDVYKVHTPQVT